MRKLLLLMGFIAFGSVIHAAERTLIHAGNLIDATSTTVQSKMTIIIEGNQIKSVEKGYVKAGKEDKVIDLKEHTVMPGLMDMHTHLSSELSPATYANAFRLNPADSAFRMVGYAEKTLMAGFTTVRDLGDSDGLTVSMKNAITAGHLKGPRIYTAGKAIATTGGHADPTNGLNHRHMIDVGPVGGVVNNPDEARKAVRQRYKEGSNLIKITATGGVLSVAASGDNPQFTFPELDAIIETAKDYNFTVAAHAHGKEGMKRAVMAGVNSIEHGTYMDEEVMAIMKEKGTYLVPTLMAGWWVMEKAKEPGYFPPVVARKALTIGPIMKDTFKKAYEYGVNIAFGTDSGVSPHGDNGHEFVLMVEGGMPAIETILSATMGSAKLLRITDQLGSIEAGKLADIVAVPGDPIKDISLMKNINFVMKDGVVYKND